MLKTINNLLKLKSNIIKTNFKINQCKVRVSLLEKIKKQG